MRPFKELLNPVTGHKDRIYWDADKARIKIQEVRQGHKDRLNKDDCERAVQAGIGHMVDETTGMLRTVELVTPDGKSADGDESTLRDARYVVNQTASSIKHSGAALNDAFIPEWRAFCSEPQNDDNVEYPVPAYVPKETRGRAAVLSSVRATPVSELKRKPGRPRREAFSAT